MTGTSVHINTDHYSSVRPFIRPFRQSDILNNRLTEEKIWNWILLADVTRVLSSKAFKHFLISVKGLGRNIYGKIRSDKTVWTIVKRRLRYLLRSLRPAIVVDDTYYYQLLSTSTTTRWIRLCLLPLISCSLGYECQQHSLSLLFSWF